MKRAAGELLALGVLGVEVDADAVDHHGISLLAIIFVPFFFY